MKNKLPLFVAIAIGIVALFSIRQYVSKMERETADQLKGDVVVAARVDLPANTELAMQMIAPKEVPAQFIPAQAIQGSDQVKLILGRKVSVPIRAGQIILWSDLASENRGGLSAIIPKGEGAFTVTISKGIKPGLLQPSDHIDILGSFAMPKPAKGLNDPASAMATWRQGSDIVNVVLLQNVTVLAVGESYGGLGRGQNQTGSDLTLSLTLQEAQLLMFASQNGELGAVLRREGATDFTPPDQRQRVTFEAVENIVGDLDGKRNFRNVDVQKGMQSTTVPVLNH
jgi:pilus assembly protein CpaB